MEKETKNPKIAVVMIVKNEEEMLHRCLDSVKEADYIYILDTGSEDNTIEVAKKHTKNVYDDYKWNDNFAEARNYILNKVKKDLKDELIYCISIDADEFLHDFSKLREAVDKASKGGNKSIDCKLIAENVVYSFSSRL